MFNFFNHQVEAPEPPRRVFSLAISEKIVQASLWEVAENVKVLAKSSAKAYFNDNDLLIKLDQCLQELGPEGQVVHQTLFHLDSSFTNEQGILLEKKPLFENMTQALQLESLGFIANVEAVLNAKLAQNPDLDQQLLVEFTSQKVIFSFYQKKNLLEQCVLEWGSGADFATLMKTALVQMAGKIGVDYSHCFLPQTDELTPNQIPTEALFVNFVSALLSTAEIEQQVHQLPASLPMRSEILGNDILLSYLLLPSATVLAKSYGWLQVAADPEETSETPPVAPAATQEQPLLSRRQFQPTVEASDFASSESDFDSAPSFSLFGLTLTKKSIFLTIGLALLTLLILGFWFLLTQTTLTLVLTPKKSLLAKNTEVIIDPKSDSVDYDQLTLPGEIVSKTVTHDYVFTATGSKNVGGSAKGEIEISNKTTQEKKFSGGSEVSNGTYTYTLDSEVTVPAAKDGDGSRTFGKAKVKVTANSPGAKGNLSNDTSLTVGTLSKSDFEAKTTENFSGGTDETATVFSEKDQQKAIKDGEAELLKEAVTQIGTQADGKYLAVQKDQLKVTKRTFDTELDAKANEVTLSLTATVPVISYELTQLQPLAQSILTKDLPSGTTFVGTEASVLSAINEDKTNKDGQKIYLTVDLSQETVAVLDTEAIKKEILGQPLTKIQNYLTNLDTVKKFDLQWSNKLYPQLYHAAPKNSGKVSVVNALE